MNTKLAFEIPRLDVFLGIACLKEPRRAVPPPCDNRLMYKIKPVNKLRSAAASRHQGQVRACLDLCFTVTVRLRSLLDNLDGGNIVPGADLEELEGHRARHTVVNVLAQCSSSLWMALERHPGCAAAAAASHHAGGNTTRSAAASNFNLDSRWCYLSSFITHAFPWLCGCALASGLESDI